jgi:glucose-1-phosphate adenylyltransferase
MGNYIFNTDVLMKVSKEAKLRGDLDFGHDIIGWLIKKYAVYAYNFCNNTIPGIRGYEQSSYWYDVGTIETYWQSHQDMLGAMPKLELDNPLWPIGGLNKSGGKACDNSLVSFDMQSDKAIVRNSIIRGHVMLGQNVVIEDSIILGDVIVKKGAHIRKAIVDHRNVIEENDRIGYNLMKDKQKYYVDPSGIVVVAGGKLKSRVPGKSNNLHNFVVPAEESLYA